MTWCDMPMEMSDEDIVECCLNGHPEIFRRLVRRYEGPLLSHLVGRLQDTERAEEATQETFVRAYFALGKLRKPESFYSWIVGISGRVLRELQRKNRRYRQALQEMERNQQEQTIGIDPDPRLKRFVAELPDVYREVVQLRYFGGLSCAALSKQLGVPVGTVTKRLSRSYELLRDALQPDHAS